MTRFARFPPAPAMLVTLIAQAHRNADSSPDPCAHAAARAVPSGSPKG